MSVSAAPGAWADSPSDPTATYSTGNATTCSDLGLPNDRQLASSAETASDGTVSGKEVPLSTLTPSGKPTSVTDGGLQVSAAAGILVDAISVKGGNAYNIYRGAIANTPGYTYIPPLNGGGGHPSIGHWVVCYQSVVNPPASVPEVGRPWVEAVAAVTVGAVVVGVRHRAGRRRTLPPTA